MPTRARFLTLLICVIVAGILYFPPGTSAAATFVGLAQSDVVASSNSVSSGNFSAAVTNGDLIVVRVFYNSASQSVSTVTDTKNNSYAKAVGPSTGTGAMASWRQEIWYARNVAGGSSLNVTATFDGTFNAEKSISAHEYSGLDTLAPLDATAAQTSSVANSSSGAASTTSAAEMIFGAALFSGCGSAGTGFVARSTLGCNVSEDKSVTTTGSYAAVFTNSAQSVIAQMATFRVAGQTSDTTPPSVPTGLSATTLSPSQIDLAWLASADNVGVVGYTVYRGTTQVATTTGITYSDTGLTASTTYSYVVTAYDAVGNASAASTSVSASTLAAGSSLTYTTTFPVTENPISENGQWINGAAAGGSLWGNVQATPGLAFGVSEPTQFGDPTAVLQGTWGADQTAQATVRVNTVPTGTCCHEVEVRLRNTISSSMITGYEVYCSVMSSDPYCHIASWGGANGVWVNMDNTSPSIYLKDGDVLKGTVTGTHPAIITMYVNGTQVLQVQDTGSFTFSDGRQYGPWTTGNPGIGFYDNQDSSWSTFGFSSFTATSNVPPDTQSPSVPTGLSATPVSPSQIDLSWIASTDNVDVASYQVFRDGAQVATSTGTSFSNTGLAASTTYTYSIAAVDAAGNVSALSTSVSPTTLAPDTAPPSAPTGLSATAVSPFQINLSWFASTDNVGVAGYRVYRGNTQIAAVTTGTSYSDAGLGPSTTYTYLISAYDAADNVSTASSVFTTTGGVATTAGTVHAVSCSQIDVQNAISSAPDGYTVVVPAGLCTWTTPAPNTPAMSAYQAAVTLQGAGIDQTVINMETGGAPNEAGLRADGVDGRQFRITGFTFSGASNNAVELIMISGTSKSFRVDHNKFTADALGTGVHVVGATYGVVDHNTFVNARTLIEDAGDGSWQQPLDLGGPDAVYVEDNTFAFNVAASTISGHNGARYVFRYNTTNASVENESGCHTGTRGTRKVEIYANTLSATGAGGVLPPVPVALRSGTGVIFDNLVSGLFGNPVIFVEDQRSDVNSCTGIWTINPMCDGAGSYDGNTPGTSGYLCRDQIGASTDSGLVMSQTADPVYAWNNSSSTTGGPVDIVPGLGAGTALHVQENRDFFNLARPGYTPYLYPHPLVSQPPPDMQAPAVSITTPLTQSTVSGTVTVSAVASDNVAVVAVGVLLDGVSLGPAMKVAPYSTVWDSATAAPGSHTLTATASDAAGNTSISAAVVVAVLDATPPIVTAVTNVDTSSNSTTINWSTDEPSDSQAVFLNGPCPNVTACIGAVIPQLVTSHSVTISGLVPSTSYSYEVNSKDAAGNVTASPPQSVVTLADTVPPTVSVSVPADGATVSGVTTSVSATASDDIGVAAVQFTLDGNNLGAEVTTPPYAITWNTTQSPNGAHLLTATARDGAGNMATSTATTVIINNDLTPPLVSVTSPANNASVAGSVSVTAGASDNVGVGGVRFTLDGVDLGPEDTSSPYGLTWNTATVPNGSHTLSAVARDAAGNSATSTVTVNVSNSISYYPATYAVGTGTYQSGNVASLTADDNSYLVIKSTTSGGPRQSRTDFGFTTVAQGVRLDYSVRLKSSTSNTTVVVSAFNYSLSTWTQLRSTSVGTSEVTVSASITTSASSYVSSDGRMLVRVQSSQGSTHSVSDELVKVLVTP